MDRSTEREAKYVIGPGIVLPDLAGVVDGAATAERGEIQLDATYFDTVDLRLLRRGVTLRHRRDGAGGEDLWTLKLPGDAGHLSFERNELSWPGSESSIPGEAVSLVAGISQGQALGPVADMTTARRRTDVHDDGGVRLAEVADDIVSVAARIPIEFRQVEVELDAGDDTVIEAITSRLAGIGATRGPDEPKLRTALAGWLSRTPEPSIPALGSDSTVGEVVTASIARGLGRLVSHDIGVRLGGDPEFVHQARVATRRLRSDLKTFRSALDQAWVTQTRSELKWIADALGDVRDADVLTERIQDHADQASCGDGKAFRSLLDHLGTARDDAVLRLRAVFDSPRYLALLGRLEAAAFTPPFAVDSPTSASDQPGRSVHPDDPARVALGRMVLGPWRKVQRALSNLDDTPADSNLHQVRIKTKQLRYAAEAAAPVIGKPARRLAKAAEDAQDLLGEHHDAVVAEEWFRASAGDANPTRVFAAGQGVVKERQRQQQWRSDWPAARDKLTAKHLRRWLH